MATTKRPKQPLKLDKQQYQVFTNRAKGNISLERQEELRQLGKALKGAKIYPLTKGE